MKRVIIVYAALFAALASWAGQVTFDFGTADGLRALGITPPNRWENISSQFTVDGVTIDFHTKQPLIKDNDAAGGYHLNLYPDNSFTLKVTQGSIVGVTATFKGSGNIVKGCNVGSFTVQDSVVTWTGSANQLLIDDGTTVNQQMYLRSVTVTTSDELPSMIQINNISEIKNLPDGTQVQYMGDRAFVYYYNGTSLYIRDSQGYGEGGGGIAMVNVAPDSGFKTSYVIYGNWTATKTTIDGIIQLVDPSGMEKSEETHEYQWEWEADNFTSYFRQIIAAPSAYVHRKIAIIDGEITPPDARGDFTVSTAGTNGTRDTIKVHNLWNIDIPTEQTTGLQVEAMVSMVDGEAVLFPINIGPYERYVELWQLIDGNFRFPDDLQVTFEDYLYVGAVVPSERQIYVTDNCDGIIIYMGWVYAFNWPAGWLCLDFGDNEELFNKVSQMKQIKSKTVKGLLYDARGNSRLVVNSEPVEYTGDDEVANILSYDLASGKQFAPLGNEVLKVKGTVKMVDGAPCLAAGLDSIDAYYLNANYATQPGRLYNGDVIEAKAIAKKITDDSAPEGMNQNYVLLLLSFDVIRSAADINGDGQVDITDVNLAINTMLGKATTPAADLNHDGQVDVTDVNLIINSMLGK